MDGRQRCVRAPHETVPQHPPVDPTPCVALALRSDSEECRVAEAVEVAASAEEQLERHAGGRAGARESSACRPQRAVTHLDVAADNATFRKRPGHPHTLRRGLQRHAASGHTII